MENSKLSIRDAVLDDAEQILKIYNYYIENTAVTFEYCPLTVEELKARMEKVTWRYPYLVAVRDGKIVGYCYSGAFVGRAAYDWSCELSVYVDNSYKGCGIGKALYEAMENKLKRMGILNFYACIAYPKADDEYLTTNSADFHRHMGFKKVGEFHSCGCKFGNWYDMIWMEKIIGEHLTCQPPIKKYPELINSK